MVSTRNSPEIACTSQRDEIEPISSEDVIIALRNELVEMRMKMSEQNKQLDSLKNSNGKRTFVSQLEDSIDDATTNKKTRLDFKKYGNNISPFDGSQDYMLWEAETRGFFDQFKEMEELEKLTFLKGACRGSAKVILDSAGIISSVRQFHEQMSKIFVSAISPVRKLMDTTQLPGESAEQFCMRLRLAVIRAHATDNTLSANQVEEYTLGYFLRNTKPEISRELMKQQPEKLQNALRSAAYIELEFEKQTTKHNSSSLMAIDAKNNTDDNKKEKNFDQAIKHLNDRITTVSKDSKKPDK